MRKAMEFTRSLAGRAFNQARALWDTCRPRTKLAIAAVPLTTVAISLFAVVFPSHTWANNDDEISTFTVDVAESTVNYRQNDVDPSEGQDVFSPGDTFILEGTIYPAGKLPRGKANNDPNDPGPSSFDLQYDGFTTVFKAEAHGLAPGTHHIKLAIADTGDRNLDSAVFIEARWFAYAP